MTTALQRTSIPQRVLVSVGLSLFFFVVYGACQAVTAARTGIPSFYFSWERRIPFVAATIIPYLSIDLFFIAAPLLITTDRQLRAHAIRVITAISVAAVFFLTLPLKFAFARPDVPGTIGFVFQLFQHADMPFNQLPSLHIALLVIVGEVFLRRTRGGLKMVLAIWFGLIAVSPVLVYQHHLIDLVAGLALGLICLNVINEHGQQPAFERNLRVGAYYSTAALALAAISVWVGKASWWLWWPALSLALVAAGYFWIGPALYAKRNGQLPWATRLLLGPTLLGQHASLWWYARRSRPYDVVTDRLWIGRTLTRVEATTARIAGVGAVIDLTCEFTEPAALRTLAYLHVPTLDLTAPTQAEIVQAIRFARHHGETTIVYLHCKAGYSRTAVIAASYLITTSRAGSVDEAIECLLHARPGLIVRTEARRAIEIYHLTVTKMTKEA